MRYLKNRPLWPCSRLPYQTAYHTAHLASTYVEELRQTEFGHDRSPWGRSWGALGALLKPYLALP
eukprot:3621952-Pyramimonas_sp.AAC.1